MTILQLPDELMLGILQHLPKAQLLLDLPLVCKAFARLLRLPSPCWAGTSFHRILNSRGCSIEGAAFCKWLEPRGAQLTKFFFPVDACLLRDNTCFTQALLAALPESLTNLTLHALGPDYQVLKNDATQLTAFPHLQSGFQVLQDTVPHLSSLARLSKLQTLSLPVHTSIDKLGLDSLGALKSLQNLHLELRVQIQDDSWHDPLAAPAFLPNANLSVLTALTELSIQGSKAQHLLGLAALPHLQCLSVSRSRGLMLAGLFGATTLTSLMLSDLSLTNTFSNMLHILRSMVQLRWISFRDLQDVQQNSSLELTSLLELPSLEHLNVSRCTEFEWFFDADSSKISSSLTTLELDIPYFWDAPEIPALGQLSHLIVLSIAFDRHNETYIIPSSLSSLLCLENLAVGPLQSWDTEQAIDITATASLGPAIKDICLYGPTRLEANSSLTALAERPNLRQVQLATCGHCSVSSDGPSWLHCAALLHALLTRPTRGLSAVRLFPDLTSC